MKSKEKEKQSMQSWNMDSWDKVHVFKLSTHICAWDTDMITECKQVCVVVVVVVAVQR